MFLISTGELVHDTVECRWPGDEVVDAPPPPPSAAEVLEIVTDQKLIPDVVPRILPPPGLPGSPVQWEMWGWCDAPGTVTIDLGPIRGWSLTATMEPINFYWSGTGSGGDHVTEATLGGDECGTPQTPNSDGSGAAWKWTPHHDGEATISLRTTWVGEMVLTYDGNSMGTVFLGDHSFTESVSTNIYEIETVN